MRTVACVACGLMLCAFIAVGCSKSDEGVVLPGAAGQVVVQKVCPVTGNPIDKKVFEEYKGRKIYFCCTNCPAEFKKDPEKYVKIVDDALEAMRRAAPATK